MKRYIGLAVIGAALMGCELEDGGGAAQPSPLDEAMQHVEAASAGHVRDADFEGTLDEYQAAERDEARAALDEAILERGYRGIKLHPTTTLAHPAGEGTVALLRRCAELGVPALFHCGDDPYATPHAIEAGAREVPDCTVVMGHMGGYFHVDDAIAAAERQPNLMLETSAMPYPRKIAEAVSRVGSDRVLFGSDGPGCNPALEVRKITMLGLDADDERRILGGNAARLLGLEAASCSTRSCCSGRTASGRVYRSGWRTGSGSMGSWRRRLGRWTTTLDPPTRRLRCGWVRAVAD